MRRFLTIMVIIFLITIAGAAYAATPIAEWKLNEGAGTTVADSAGLRPGTLQGSTAWGDDAPPGVTPAKCVKFAGAATSYIDFANGTDAALVPQNLTVALWVKASGNHAGQVMLSKYNTAPGSHEFAFSAGAPSYLFWRVWNTSGEQYFLGFFTTAKRRITSTEFNDGKWHLIAGTYDSTTGAAKLYYDGILLDVYYWTPGTLMNAGDAQPLNLARRAYSGAEAPYNSYMSTVRIYDTALTAEEIADLSSLKGTVTGRVCDAANPSTGISGAKVKASSGQSTTTGTNGNYSITINSDTDVTLSFLHDDYYPTQTNVTVSTGSTVTGVNASLTHLPTPGPADMVTDTFERWWGLDLGTTEDVNQYPWIRGSGETSSSIAGNPATGSSCMQLGSGPANYGVSIGGFPAADVDITCDLMITGQYQATIAYRGKIPGQFNNSGYAVNFWHDGSFVQLWKGGELVRKAFVPALSWGFPIPVRVRAIGSRHQVWVNGEECIDVMHSGMIKPGYVSLIRSGSTAHFDNLTVTRYWNETGQISGVVSDSGNSTAIAGAKVLLSNGHAVITNSLGEYLFTSLAPGTYKVTAYLDGYYASVCDGISLPESGSSAVQNIFLTPAAASSVITDDFNRADGTELGTTTDALHLPWIADATAPSAIQAWQLSLPVGTPAASHAGVSLGGNFLPADIDVQLDFSIPFGGMAGDHWFGIGYRMDQPNRVAFDNGYQVRCDEYGTYVELRKLYTLARVALPQQVDWSSPHTLRVRALGLRHEVWLDNIKLIDYIHEVSLDKPSHADVSGGYFTIMRNSSSVMCDNLNIATFTAPTGVVTGKVHDAVNPGTGVPGAMVLFSTGEQAVANANGIYTANVRAMNPVSMRVAGGGYSNASVAALKVVPGSTLTQDVGLAKSDAAFTIFDTFSRPNGDNIGTTEDPGHLTWLKDPNSVSYVWDQMLWFSYGGYPYGVNFPTEFQPKDFDLSVDIKVAQKAASDWFVIPYRQGSPDNPNGLGYPWDGYQITFDSAGAYVAMCYNESVPQLSTNSNVRLYGPKSIWLETPIDWSVTHNVRLKVAGARHQLWIDGEKIYDLIDWNKLDGGYLGFTRWNSLVTFDNLTLLGPQAVRTSVANAAEAKAAADGALVSLSGPVVTAVFNGCFYVEDIDRTAGIKVASSKSVKVGDAVTLEGIIGTVDGEKQLTATSVSVLSSGNTIEAIGLTNKSNAPAVGLSNVGLLTKIWGKVTGPETPDTYCYVDDGSGVSNEPETTGVKVLIAGMKKPVLGDFVTCTGITRMTTGSVPVLQMRTDNDLVIAN